MPKTFITGATGDIGTKLIEQCKKSGTSIRVLSRRQAQVDKFKEDGIDVVVGGLTDVKELSLLMRGCDTLLLNVAAVKDQLEQSQNAIDAAIKAGLKWIIKISAGDARLGTNVPWVTAHYHADNYLREKARLHEIEFTLLPASAFMSNLLAAADPIRQGFFIQCAGDGQCGWVDTQDIADVCHQILLDGPEEHRGKEYFLTGPALITMSDIAAALTRHVGHKVRYVDLPGPVFNALLRMGVDAWQANGLTAQFNEIIRPNKEGVAVSSATQTITGRPATSINLWVEKNKKTFDGCDALPYFQGGAFLGASVVAYWVYRYYGST